MIYVAMLLAGLGVVVYPGIVYPSRADVPSAPLPVLQTVAVAQLAYILLAFPLVLFAPRRKGLMPRYPAEATISALVPLPWKKCQTLPSRDTGQKKGKTPSLSGTAFLGFGILTSG